VLFRSKDAPSWTIQAQPGSSIGPFHWKNRRLSTHELLRLMTFPDICVMGGRTSIQRQLGNAVPSLMTEILGWSIRSQFLDGAEVVDFTLMPQKNGKAPVRERLKKVPEKYLDLVGNHDPHPGTGKGPSAIRRKAVIEKRMPLS